MQIIKRSSIPEECIHDCSRPGPVDEAVESWRTKLNFRVNRRAASACVLSSGGWDRAEVEASTDEDLARRILWFVCGSFDEDPEADVYYVEG